MPGDHLRLLLEILKPNQLELGRRWVAALMLVPEAEREAMVEAVEREIVEQYAPGASQTEPKPR